MKKKKLVILLALIVIIAVPFSVFAATSDAPAAKKVRGFFGIDASKLTEQQKADVKDYSEKMADLQKQFINKMVENGSMTKEQGDAAIKRIDDMLQNGEVNGFMGGMGGFGRHGRQDGFVKNKIDFSKLTDQQKADLKASTKKMTDLQKELVSKMVANGLLTEEQGDAATQKIDSLAENSESSGYGMMLGRGIFGGFGIFGVKGMDISKLTDQQKADLTDFSQKMADLQKESVNKMVANGLMTEEQGKAAIQRIDDMQNQIKENGFESMMGMKKGRKGGAGIKNDSGVNNDDASSM